MNQRKPKVLIGPLFADPAESVSAVNRAFISGLSGQFTFLVGKTRRDHGNTRQSRLNIWNLWYLLKQGSRWLIALIWYRPEIAHYAVNSGWAMEKSLFFLALARWNGAKTLGHLHSGDFLNRWAALPGWRRRMAMWQLLKLDGLIVLSEWWREQLVQGLGIPRSMLWVVNNPLNQAFEQQALALPVERANRHLLSVGTMGRDKGVHELVEACGIVQRAGTAFHLNLVGPERDPGVRSRVEQQLSRDACTERVSLAEGVFGDAKLELFRQTSIFVLPSYYENFPLVVLEAAAAGQAIVTTPVGAVPEFFQDGVSALFVEPGNACQLADAIMYLLNTPDERCRLATEARHVFECKLGRSGIMTALDRVYSAVIERTT